MRPRERYGNIREGLSVRLLSAATFSSSLIDLPLGSRIWSIRICPPIWHDRFERAHEFYWSRPQSHETNVQFRL
jgi:hypothetical protein